MNELQEAILDTLMVADRIGDRWKPGPLHLAFEALQNAGLTRRKDPAGALGYPPVLCAAVEGAATTVRTVDDCRTLSISLFSEVPPRKRTPKLTDPQLVAVALWSVRRLPSYDAAPVPLVGEVEHLLEEYLAGEGCEESTLQRMAQALDRSLLRIDLGGREYTPELLARSAVFFAFHTLRRAQNGGSTEENACRVTRDVGRLAGLVGGVGAAVPYCVELAHKNGM